MDVGTGEHRLRVRLLDDGNAPNEHPDRVLNAHEVQTLIGGVQDDDLTHAALTSFLVRGCCAGKTVDASAGALLRVSVVLARPAASLARSRPDLNRRPPG